jgi:S-DNA-T family DNA segregation ATPase FtsK/SpoIIIE
MKKPNLNIILGKDSEGNYFSYDISRMGHLLIGGEFGTGKTQFLHNTIKQLIENNSPEEIKLIISAGDFWYFKNYSELSHMLIPCIEKKEALIEVLNWLNKEEEKRMRLFLNYKLRNIDEFNEKFPNNIIPNIVVVINDCEYFVNGNSQIEKLIIKILQYSKYSGIHLILTTEVGEKGVLSPMIKSNIGTKIVFKTKDINSSFLLLDQEGAEELNGKGEFLFLLPNSVLPKKLQCDYISNRDITKFIEKSNVNKPNYDEGLENTIYQEDGDISDYLIQAENIFRHGAEIKAYILMNQLGIRHAKAVKIIEFLEKQGLIRISQDTGKLIYG